MLCVYSVFVLICNTRNSLTTKRHAPVPARSVASLPASRLAALACYAVARRSLGLRVFACYALTGAIVCRPTLRRFAPSLRAQFSFFTLPGVPRLRRSTAGLLYGAPPGLRIPLAYGSQFPLQLPISRLNGVPFPRNKKTSCCPKTAARMKKTQPLRASALVI